MKAVSLALAIVLSVMALFLSCGSVDNNAEQDANSMLVTNALASTFLINPVDYSTTGTGFIINREKLPDGSYLYHAVTAYHVIDSWIDTIEEQRDEASRDLQLTFQPTIHGSILRIDTQFQLTGIQDPVLDWATFSFETFYFLPLLEIASEDEFKELTLDDNIYLIGCDRSFGPVVRSGTIGATNCIAYIDLTNDPLAPGYHQFPYKYFRPAITIWYGASGGPIINKNGRVIGIVNAVGGSGTFGHPITHLAITLKAHNISEGILERAPELLAIR